MVKGMISEIGDGYVKLTVPYDDTRALIRQEIIDCEVYFHDGRQLSPDQRRKIFAMVSDIGEYVAGLDKKKRAEREILCSLQLDYLIDTTNNEAIRRKLTHDYCALQGIDLFSLSDRSPDTIDMTTARDFIDWLVELCVIQGIPCQDTLLNRCEDIGRYLYACLVNKRCCITGRKAELHHVDAVGMGRNRKEICHKGMRALPLCREMHTEAHAIGQKAFAEKYHVFGIRLDEELCRIWKLKG